MERNWVTIGTEIGAISNSRDGRRRWWRKPDYQPERGRIGRPLRKSKPSAEPPAAA